MRFKKKEKASPIVIFNEITAEVEKDWNDISWKFTYDNVEFRTEDHILEVPSIEDLNQYLSWVDDNKKEILKSVTETMKEWGGNIGAAKIGCVTILNTNKITVLFLGDDTWGDMGGDFIIENGVITDWGWGD